MIKIEIRFCLHGVYENQNRNSFFTSLSALGSQSEFVFAFMMYPGILIGMHLSLHGVAGYCNRDSFLTS